MDYLLCTQKERRVKLHDESYWGFLGHAQVMDHSKYKCVNIKISSKVFIFIQVRQCMHNSNMWTGKSLSLCRFYIDFLWVTNLLKTWRLSWGHQLGKLACSLHRINLMPLAILNYISTQTKDPIEEYTIWKQQNHLIYMHLGRVIAQIQQWCTA